MVDGRTGRPLLRPQSFEDGGGMGRPLHFETRFDSMQQVLRMTTSGELLSHAWAAVVMWRLTRMRQVMHDPGMCYTRHLICGIKSCILLLHQK